MTDESHGLDESTGHEGYGGAVFGGGRKHLTDGTAALAAKYYDDAPSVAQVYGLPDSGSDAPGDPPESSDEPSEPQWQTPENIAKIAKTPLPSFSQPKPTALWGMVDAVAVSFQVPRDLAFSLILAILATATGGRRRVLVTRDWIERLAIYSVGIAPSGERKSPVFAILSAPLREEEAKMAAAAKPDHSRQRAIRDVRANAVEKIKKKGNTSDEALAELDSAVKELEEAEVPPIPQFLVDDSTPEALAPIMAEQGGRLGALSPEGGLFSVLAGRYTGGQPNLDLVLKAWSGDYCRIDRVSRDKVVLKEPFLAIGLTVQPDILPSIAEGKDFRGSGLLARFLYAYPESRVGLREVNPDPVPERVLRDYDNMVRALVRTVRDSADPVDLKLTDDAKELLDGYRRGLEPRLHPEAGDVAKIADIANKLPGQLVRIAALLTLAGEPGATQIDHDVMRDALALGPYYLDHAAAAFDQMTGKQAPLDPARAVLRWIRSKNLAQFTTRDAQRALKGQAWLNGVENLREALNDLHEFGWVRPRPEAQDGPGRPKEWWDVNPAASSGDFGTTREGAA